MHEVALSSSTKSLNRSLNTTYLSLFVSSRQPCAVAASEPVKAGLIRQVVYPKRFGMAQEFALLAASLIDNGYMNGEVIRMDGGIRFANL